MAFSNITFINYLAVILACFIALPLSCIVSWMAREELRPGLKYFFALQNLLLGFLLFVLLENIVLIPAVSPAVSSAVSVISSASLAAGLFYVKHPRRDILIYIIFAIFLALAFRLGEVVFLLSAVIIFLYGLPAGAIISFFHLKEKKNRMLVESLKDVLLNFSFFVVIAVIAYFM